MTFAPQREEGVGTIDSIISRSIIRRVYNDGDRTYLTLQQEARNSLPITQQSTAIIIPMTNPNIDFVQFDKSYISLKVSVRFDLTGYAKKNGDDDTVAPDAYRMFVGLKNSSDCIGEYAIYHKGKQVSGTLQSNATVESFLYHTFRSENDKMYRPHVHSIAHRVRVRDLQCSCGRYPSLKDIQDPHGKTPEEKFIWQEFDLQIPFNNILPFQQFRSYPAALFGDLEFRFKFNPNAFVTLQTDPVAVIEAEASERFNNQFDDLAKVVGYSHIDYTNDYVCVGDTFTGITHITVGTGKLWGAGKRLEWKTGQVSWNPTQIKMDDVHAVLVGYKAHPRALEQMRGKFMQHPWVKFSQNINYLPFSSKVNSTGINIVQQSYLNNTTDLILLFPTSEHEAQGTVSKNPHLKDLSITTLNRRYPEVPINTRSAEYLQTLLTSTDTFNKTPSRELVDSVMEPRWNNTGRFTNTTDRTSFVAAIKVERPSAMGLICDGLDSKGFQVPIRLSAQPTYDTTKDTATVGVKVDQYCAVGEKIPPPILITVNDAYWIFNAKNGGQCIYSNRPFNETVDLFMAQ